MTTTSSDSSSAKFNPYKMHDPSQIAQRLESIIQSITEKKQIALFIEPTSHCNLSCSFCAMHSTAVDLDNDSDGKVARKTKSHMRHSEFSLLLSAWRKAELPPLKMLQFSGHGEPLLNKELEKMVASAKETNISELISVTTNGVLLNKDRFISLINAGVNEFRVSLDSLSKETYKAIKGADEAERLKNNILECLSVLKEKKPPVRMMIECIRLHEKGTKDLISEEKLINTHLGQAVTTTEGASLRWRDEMNWIGQMGHGEPFYRNKPCEFPFYVLLIHSDCTISSCCADTAKKFVIGNLKTVDNFREITENKLLRDLQRSLLKLEFHNLKQCSRCNFKSLVDDALLENRDSILKILDSDY